jgi:hypothetical protein
MNIKTTPKTTTKTIPKGLKKQGNVSKGSKKRGKSDFVINSSHLPTSNVLKGSKKWGNVLKGNYKWGNVSKGNKKWGNSTKRE